MNEIIKTENVYYKYRTHSDANEVYAVENVTFTVFQGQFVVVLGRNGSGKSTLARLMNTLLIPNEGTIIIDGIDTRNQDKVWDIRKNLGLVLQNPDNQIVATTVEEDVAFGPENLGIPPLEIRQRVDKSLQLVNMTDYLSHSPHMLSGGQKQRIAIAGILAMEPKCIVLDESTSMLDPSGRKEVMEVLHSLNRDKGITILLITHHMDEAIQADRVIVMQGGKIYLNGSPRTIFENVDEIRGAGLDVPQVTALAYRLKKQGFPFKRLSVTMNEMLEDMNDIFGEKLLQKNITNNGCSAKNAAIRKKREKNIDDIISIQELCHTYMPDTTYERKALKNINLTVKKGEIIGIIGHTGSGKSTLVQHLNGILKPTSGKLVVDGLKAEGKALKELREKVGLIFQYPEHQLFEETVFKDITFGLQKMKLSDDEIRQRVFHVTDLLDISPEILEKSPFELSGGQKRRVAIAGVLVMEPGVLVLDEPTAGLDPKGSSEVYSLLKRLNEDEQKTIIIISHNMEEIAELCDRVAVMSNGELILCDSTEKVFSKEEELKGLGLDIPKITQLFNNLNLRGFNLPSPVLTVSDAESIICGLYTEHSGGAGL